MGASSQLQRCLGNLPDHTHVSIEVDIAAIDSYDSEQVVLQLDGETVWTSGVISRKRYPESVQLVSTPSVLNTVLCCC